MACMKLGSKCIPTTRASMFAGMGTSLLYCNEICRNLTIVEEQTFEAHYPTIQDYFQIKGASFLLTATYFYMKHACIESELLIWLPGSNSGAHLSSGDDFNKNKVRNVVLVGVLDGLLLDYSVIRSFDLK